MTTTTTRTKTALGRAVKIINFSLNKHFPFSYDKAYKTEFNDRLARNAIAKGLRSIRKRAGKTAAKKHLIRLAAVQRKGLRFDVKNMPGTVSNTSLANKRT